MLHPCQAQVLSTLSTAVAFLRQWHRTPTTQETDGFQVKRPGDVSVRCTLLLMLDYQVRAEGCEVRRRGELWGWPEHLSPVRLLLVLFPDWPLPWA